MGVEMTCWLPSLIAQLLSTTELSAESVAPATRDAIAFATTAAPPAEQMRRLLTCAELQVNAVEASTSVLIARSRQALGLPLAS